MVKVSKEITINCAGVDTHGDPVLPKKTRETVLIDVYPGPSVTIHCAHFNEGKCAVSGQEGVSCKQVFPEDQHRLNIMSRLNRRQQEVFLLLPSGLQRDEIAKTTGKTDFSTRGIIYDMYSRLGIENRNQAIALGLASGDIKPPHINTQSVKATYDRLDAIQRKVIRAFIYNDSTNLRQIMAVTNRSSTRVREVLSELYDTFRVRNMHHLFYVIQGTDMLDPFPRLSEEEK